MTDDQQRHPSPGRSRGRRSVVFAAVGGALVLGAAGVLAYDGMSDPAAAAPLSASLVCSGEQTVEFTPAITDKPTKITGQGSGRLDDCQSPNHTLDEVKSAEISYTLSATASCSQPSTGTGETRITWYGEPDQQGPVLGTTTVRSQDKQTLVGDPKNHKITGDVRGVATRDSSLLADHTAIVSVSPAHDGQTPDCQRGVREGTGTAMVSFQEPDSDDARSGGTDSGGTGSVGLGSRR
ncbi:hypothetical protein [Streptoalloteichus hindustanus]|uniref:Uncharacterized protein n=1 Tax=Streptoalloteichus hindustanus TaxID=2017 RepID=A0A1M5CHN9_STRHI|nr:hypothetical protein [Streptoalloteichus hindustanus]SHF54273.1 hypothetical protein SAMN05444320_10432 [Streptoalloteichus hindustanus]